MKEATQDTRHEPGKPVTEDNDGVGTTAKPKMEGATSGVPDRARDDVRGDGTGGVTGEIPGGVPEDERRDLSDVPFPSLIEEMIRRLGDDPGREGLLRTPLRVEEALSFLTAGYGMSAHEAIGDALFEERHQNMVLVKDIEMYSLCEHHLLPFFGKVHVAYIPDGHILGLSKMARLVDVYARRLQVQERLTDQIAQALWDIVEPQGVGVVVEAYHLCMMMRGVQKQNSKTITSAMRGAFMEDMRTRDEFLRLSMAGHEPLS